MTDEVPSPPRNRGLAFWRTERGGKFVREVGSVVLGVLIALGLGAVASEIGWNLEVRTARDAMQAELGELIGQGEERAKVLPCVERRLDAIAAVIAQAETSGKLPPLGSIGLPPWRTWSRGVWASTVSAETAAHMDREVLDNYSGAYEFADNLYDLGRREIPVWTKLTSVVGPGRPFSSAEAIELRDAIGEARMIARMMAGNGIRLKQVVTAFDLGYDEGGAREYSERDLGAYSICDPIGSTPPASYGQAPFENIVDNAHSHPITRDSGGGVSAKR